MFILCLYQNKDAADVVILAYLSRFVTHPLSNTSVVTYSSATRFYFTDSLYQ